MTNNSLWSIPLKKLDDDRKDAGSSNKFIIKAKNPRLLEKNTKFGNLRSILAGIYDVCDDSSKKEDVELTVYEKNSRAYELIAYWPNDVFVTVEGTYTVNNNSKYKNRLTIKRIIEDGNDIPF